MTPEQAYDWLAPKLSKPEREALDVIYRAAPEGGVPVAWSPRSKSGLMRGIRYGLPTAEDLAIAEGDGDTVVYFAECKPQSDCVMIQPSRDQQTAATPSARGPSE